LGTNLSISTIFHPQTDGQSERVIQILEDLQRACALEFGGNWEEHLSLVEFTYNNSYQTIIGMAPFEALYGKKCRTPLCWEEVEDRKLYGAELVQITTKKVRIIKDRMKVAQDRQKKYEDIRRRPLEFCPGDKVFLKVATWKHMLRFGMKGKLASKFIGPFEIRKFNGLIAYEINLPSQLAKVHNVFHVSLLQKADVDPSRVLPQMPVKVKEDLTLEVRPIKILDWGEKELRNKKAPIIRVLWQSSQIEEETWERESEMRRKFPNLFINSGTSLKFRR